MKIYGQEVSSCSAHNFLFRTPAQISSLIAIYYDCPREVLFFREQKKNGDDSITGNKQVENQTS